MKNINLKLTLLLFCSFQLFSQTKTKSEEGKTYYLYSNGTWSEEIKDVNNCENLIKKVTTTKTTGHMTINPIRVPNKKTLLTIELVKNENVTVLNMKVQGDNICFNTKDIATFTFLDGETLKLPFSSSVGNCKGEFTLFFGKPFKNNEHLNSLNQQQLKTFELGEHHFNVNEYESKVILKTLNCLNEIN
jgi:hypothetical protein